MTQNDVTQHNGSVSPATGWTEQDTVKLRELLLVDPPLSLEEIGRRMGRTKNSIVGKVTREIFPEYERRARKPIRYRTEDYFPPPRHCLWPYGNPGESDFHFCGKFLGEMRGVYCAAHAAIAGERDPERATRYFLD